MNSVMLFSICVGAGFLLSMFMWVAMSFILSMADFSLAKMFSREFIKHIVDEMKFAFSWKMTIFASFFIGWFFFVIANDVITKREMEKQGMCTCKCEVCKKVASIVLSTNIVNKVTK